MTDFRIAAIRDHKLVGRGTCSIVDECWSDGDILNLLNDEGMSTVLSALKWALDMESRHMEQGLNQRWGEDNDPQLIAYNEWQEKLKKETGQ